jgi:hypothetical protein
VLDFTRNMLDLNVRLCFAYGLAKTHYAYSGIVEDWRYRLCGVIAEVLLSVGERGRLRCQFRSEEREQ